MKTTQSRTLSVIALVLGLTTAGCIDAINEDDGLEAAAAGDGTVGVSLVPTAIPEELTRLNIELAGVFVHKADVALPDGFIALDTVTDTLDLLASPGANLEVASGASGAGSYDQVLVRIAALEGATNDTGFAGESTAGFDVPILLAFDVLANEDTAIELTLDVGASTATGTFVPSFSRAVVRRGGSTVTDTDDVQVQTGAGGSMAPVSTAPPVARISLFDPAGALIFKSSFLAEDDEFANDLGSAIAVGGEAQLSGVDSEAVEPGATVESYAWDFDDGTTGTGPTVGHAFNAPGVFEVTLTVTDSLGGTDSQVVRVVTAGWSQVSYSTDFEEAEEGWTASDASALPLSEAGLLGWMRDGPGHESDTSWHVGNHVHSVCDVGLPACALSNYLPLMDSTLVSPAFDVPAEWNSAGVKFWISGASEAGFDILRINVSIDGGEPIPLGEFQGSMDWTEVGALDNLDAAVGSSVQFTFHFVSDLATETGPGWYVDDLVIGGNDVAPHKPALLEELAGGHDGHDHEH